MAKDPSAMGLLERIPLSQPGTLRAIDLASRHARNVDKQRRRLLAEKVERLKEQEVRAWAHDCADCRAVARRHATRAAKLRALAARLRGEK